MRTERGLGKNGKMSPRPRNGIRVVDLSQATSRGITLSSLHTSILDTLRKASAGILTTEELLSLIDNHSLSEVLRALRDLSVRGMVKVLWRTPFRFLAFVTERGKAEIASPILLVRTHPS